MVEVVKSNRQAYNAYQREYYHNVVDKEKRKQQFQQYYKNNKERLKAQRQAQKAKQKQ